MQPLSYTEKQKIIQLRLIIARAAQEDSLKWWDDNALTPSGGFLLDKVFVFAPTAAGKALALQTARSRYEAAFENAPGTLHLFRLEFSGAVEYHFREVDIMKIDPPANAIASLDELKQLLLRIIPAPPGYQVVSERADHRLEIRLRDDRVRTDPARLAQVFAWASLEGKPGYPLFPYLASYS